MLASSYSNSYYLIFTLCLSPSSYFSLHRKKFSSLFYFVHRTASTWAIFKGGISIPATLGTASIRTMSIDVKAGIKQCTGPTRTSLTIHGTHHRIVEGDRSSAIQEAVRDSNVVDACASCIGQSTSHDNHALSGLITRAPSKDHLTINQENDSGRIDSHATRTKIVNLLRSALRAPLSRLRPYAEKRRLKLRVKRKPRNAQSRQRSLEKNHESCRVTDLI